MTNETPTPRTDAVVKHHNNEHVLLHLDYLYVVPSVFARTLERELNNAEKQVLHLLADKENWKKCSELEHQDKLEIIKQRDNAEKQVAELGHIIHRARVAFHSDESDNAASVQMLRILDEALDRQALGKPL